MRVFICYAHSDKQIVKRRLVVPLTAADVNVWFDERIPAGENWRDKLREEIEKCDVFLYAVSPASIESEWCQWEFLRAAEYRKRVIPVLLRKTPHIPSALSELQYVDFTQGATDNAVDQLIAGIQHSTFSTVPTVTIPFDAVDPQGTPPQDKAASSVLKFVLRLIRDPGAQFVVALLALIVAVITIPPTVDPDRPIVPETVPTPTATPSMPPVPIIIALGNLDVRSEPGAAHPIIWMLTSNNSLEVHGITPDRRWYQVLLPSGTYGWVLASELYNRFVGSPTLLQVVTVTATLTPTTEATATATLTASYTPTATSTETASPTVTATETTSTSTATDPSAPVFVPTISATQPIVVLSLTPATFSSPPNLEYQPGSEDRLPCVTKIIDGGNDMLNIVRANDTRRSPLVRPVFPNEEVIIVSRGSISGATWFQIMYRDEQFSGWVPSDYVVQSSSCP